MEQKADRYIDRMGGEWGLDFQYFRGVVKIYCENIRAQKPYERVAGQFRSTYGAIQQGSGRAAKRLWSSGKEILKRDLRRPAMLYPGPLSLARWVARVVTDDLTDW